MLMKYVANTKLIRRNKKIGQTLTLAALAVLGIGLYYSFAKPELVWLTFGALLVGFILTQIGIFFGNRWGRSPRPDEVLSTSLKGMDERYTLYHYIAGTSHFLLGPAGVFALVPMTVSGKISYDEKKQRFTQKGGNFYMKIFGQEGLGKPDSDARYAIEDLDKFLKKNFPDLELPQTEAILVFTNPKVELDTANAPIAAVTNEKLKDYLRKRQKEKVIPFTNIQILQKSLPSEDI
jgi:hypothetical protein